MGLSSAIPFIGIAAHAFYWVAQFEASENVNEIYFVREENKESSNFGNILLDDSGNALV